MVKKIRNVIEESERNRIMELHRNPDSFDFVISDWLSPDEKYCIFLDELYDIENKKKLGDIWENFDNFKFFIKHSFEVAENVPQQIKEEVLTSINGLILTESNQDFRILKPYVKELLKEWTLNPFSSEFYSGKNWSDIGTGIKNTADAAWEGVKGVVKGITKGDWSQVLSIIGKGALWVARKIRSALYNPIGLIFDAILVATGIGKSVQFVIWAVVVALDIYELVSGDYEDPDLAFGWRLLFLGVDLIGLVSAGVAAKSAKGIVGSLVRKFGSSSEAVIKAVKSSPILQSTAETMLRVSKSAGGLMDRAAAFLQKNAPMIYKFVSGIIGKLSKFIGKLVDFIGGLLGVTGKVLSTPGKVASKVLGGGKLGKGAQAAINTGAIVYGSEKILGHGNKGGGVPSGELDKINFATAQVDFSQGL